MLKYLLNIINSQKTQETHMGNFVAFLKDEIYVKVMRGKKK